jgi:hypothetical protein
MRYAIEISTPTRVTIVDSEQELAESDTDGKVLWTRSLHWDGEVHSMQQWVEFMNFDGDLCRRLRNDCSNAEVMDAVKFCICRKRGPRKGRTRIPRYVKRSIAA